MVRCLGCEVAVADRGCETASAVNSATTNICEYVDGLSKRSKVLLLTALGLLAVVERGSSVAFVFWNRYRENKLADGS